MIVNINFESFVLSKSPALIRYCTAITCGIDAEDAAQEAFIRLWRNWHKLGNETQATAYLYRAAYSACVDMLRAKKRFRTASQAIKHDNINIPDRLVSALKLLKTIDRAILYGRACDEKSYAVLALEFEHNEAWVRKRYSLAKIKLQKLLSCDDKEEL